jgi:anti-sigma-K factor RskA
VSDLDELDPSDDDLREVELLLRSLDPADSDRFDPPTDLWSRIEAEVAEAANPAPTAPVISLEQRRRRVPKGVFVGAVAAALLAVVGIAVVAQPDDGATVVASAELTYDPENFDALGADASAQVTLVDDDGTLRIDIEQSTLPSPTDENADLELWLIEPDADGNPAELVSLGVVDPDRPGDFAVPATTDPSAFNVVDISIEPRDGDATHSGRSILRGALEA